MFLDRVLILVLVEYSRPSPSQFWHSRAVCLNPCFSGIFSANLIFNHLFSLQHFFKELNSLTLIPFYPSFKFFAKVHFFRHKADIFFTLPLQSPHHNWFPNISEQSQNVFFVVVFWKLSKKARNRPLIFNLLQNQDLRFFANQTSWQPCFLICEKNIQAIKSNQTHISLTFNKISFIHFFANVFCLLTPPWPLPPTLPFHADHRWFSKNNPCTACNISPDLSLD